MRTRAAAKRAAEDTPSIPSLTQSQPGNSAQGSPNTSLTGQSPDLISRNHVYGENSVLPTPPTSEERLRPKRGRKTPAVPVRGGWDVLPHNLGRLWQPETTKSHENEDPFGPDQTPFSGISLNPNLNDESLTAQSQSATSHSLASIPPTGENVTDASGETKDIEVEENTAEVLVSESVTSGEKTQDQVSPPKKRQLRPRKPRSDLPIETSPTSASKAPGKPSRKRKRANSGETILGDGEDEEVEDAPKKKKRKARKTADNPYGMTPGETPYSEWNSPSAEECEHVYRILADMHDDVNPLPPEIIPAPSLEVAGCGEVPSVLDGLIRTVLSGSTTFDMADKMLQSVVKRFGVLEEGIGKGSVNWNTVRTASYDDLYQSLKLGGLGAIKTKNIQGILQMVYDENMERREAYLAEEKGGEVAHVPAASKKTKGQKDLEILKAEQDMLSLDHMHDMTKDEAMRHFVRYPGVGVKTAACVTLFSLQRPCFAVDTHVYRMSRWMKWVPPKTNENDTFSHLEVRCPDHLKYGLHQLFIRHGKTCHRCNDKSFMGTKEWDEATCPLEEVMDRFTKKLAKPKEPTEGKKGKKMKKEETQEGEEDDEKHKEQDHQVNEVHGKTSLSNSGDDMEVKVKEEGEDNGAAQIHQGEKENEGNDNGDKILIEDSGMNQAEEDNGEHSVNQESEDT